LWLEISEALSIYFDTLIFKVHAQLIETGLNTIKKLVYLS